MIQFANWKKSGRVYCGPDCVKVMRGQVAADRRASRQANCAACAKVFEVRGKAKLEVWRRSGRTFCSDGCRDLIKSQESSERMARTNRVHASARMLARNPMRSEETRERMAATLREIGHQPRVRGGNGKPVPESQRMLAEFLGWPTEVTVVPKDGEMPWHYKADMAHPIMKVCVEVDGGSHFSLARRESDTRRDRRLAGLGWLTFRFSNRDAMERTAECARTVLSTTLKWQARIPT